MTVSNSPAPPTGVTRALSILAGRWKVVLAVTVLVMAASYAYVSFLADPVFESTASVTYQEPDRSVNPTNGALPSNGVTRENVATLIAAASNIQVLQAAADKADVSPEELKASVALRPHGDASTFDFVARSSSPEQAALMANAYATAFVENRRAAARSAIQRQIDEKNADLKRFGKLKLRRDDPRGAVGVQLAQDLSNLKTQLLQWGSALYVSSEAAQNPDPVWPRTSLTLAAALLLGLGLGSGVALLTSRIDRKVHGDDIDDLPAPVLVRVPFSEKAPKAGPLSPSVAEPLVADAFAALGARIMMDTDDSGRAHVVLVSSARSGEGKSTVAANLASALAQGGRRVVLLDADMRRPTQDKMFATLEGRPGLSQVLTNSSDIEQALTLVAPNLAAIASGPLQPNASVLLASVAFRQLLDRLSNISEIIVIDAPPALAVTDALAIAPTADRVLLVARVDASNMGEVEQAHQRLASAANTPQAIVLLGTRRPTGYGYDGGGNPRLAAGMSPVSQPSQPSQPARGSAA